MNEKAVFLQRLFVDSQLIIPLFPLLLQIFQAFAITRLLKSVISLSTIIFIFLAFVEVLSEVYKGVKCFLTFFLTNLFLFIFQADFFFWFLNYAGQWKSVLTKLRARHSLIPNRNFIVQLWLLTPLKHWLNWKPSIGQ